jgi:hypothetical protein
MDIDDIRGGGTISCLQADGDVGDDTLYKLIMTPPPLHVITISSFSLLLYCNRI